MQIDWTDCLKLAHKVSYLQAAQELNGIGFDREGAVALVRHIEQEMAKIEEVTLPLLPMRNLKKSEQHAWQMPLKPFKKDGSYSELMNKFAARIGGALNADNTLTWEGQNIPICGGKMLDKKLPMDLSNQDDLKAWLLSENWEPTWWNFKKGPDGKPIREKGEYVKSSPKISDGGKICPNLLAMSGDLVKPIAKWLSYRNRMSVLQGWLANPRLEYDGRLPAAVAGLAATHRKKHAVTVNLPKADPSVLLGTEVRGLFQAAPGKVLLGYDFAKLESLIEAHYVLKYPGGVEYAQELIDGDIHAKTARFVFAKELEGVPDDKEHPLFKQYRQKAKTIKYASTYGASAKKIARTLGEPDSKGEIIHSAFWEAAKPLALFKESVERFWETQGQKKWVLGVMGARLWSRAKHSLCNTIFQHAGAVCMDVSEAFMDKYLGGLVLDRNNKPCYTFKGHEVRRVAEMHDEVVWELSEEVVEDVAALAMRAVRETGKFLKLRVELAAEWKVGKSWAEIH